MRSPTRIDTSRTLVGPGCPLPRNSSCASTASDVAPRVPFPELIQGEEAGLALGALAAGDVGLGDAGQLCDRLLGEPTLLPGSHQLTRQPERGPQIVESLDGRRTPSSGLGLHVAPELLEGWDRLLAPHGIEYML